MRHPDVKGHYTSFYDTYHGVFVSPRFLLEMYWTSPALSLPYVYCHVQGPAGKKNILSTQMVITTLDF